jgi:hypothetical protein
LGQALIANKGFAAPEVGESYDRARQLCQHLNRPQQLGQVLVGQFVCRLVRGELDQAARHVPLEKVRKPGEPLGMTWDQYTKQKQIEETWRAIIWTAAPPLGLLIAWFTGAWIVRGFRED